MKITDVHRWEKAISLVLKIDGWDLEWVGDKNLPYDAIGTTPKGYDCVMEMKFRDKYYEEKLLEKQKYDELMKLNVVALYFVNDPKGNYLYWLNKLDLPEPTELYCPSTTLWNSKKIKKPVYLLQENQASIINLNK
jgi:hypothetical protein|tara:strand:+ start:334 stop:741 length:408 start_codon:yes stop_codon:yes gene_type:complete